MSSTDAAPPVEANYQGFWWNPPEPGWAINLEHQGNTVFATWLTYDTHGKTVWLTMAAQKVGSSTFVGTLYTTRGPAFNAEPFDAKAVVATEAGTGTLSFTDADTGTFRYVIGAVDQSKQITRYTWGKPSTCTFGASRALSGMWWNNPPGSEPGWGLSLGIQTDLVQPNAFYLATMVMVWYTYDLDGSPMWLIGSAQNDALAGDFEGLLHQASGARFDAFNPADVVYTSVGEFWIGVYANGPDRFASFRYSARIPGMTESVDATKGMKPFVFAAPVTETCKDF